MPLFRPPYRLVSMALLVAVVATTACSAQPASLPAAPPHPGIDVRHYAFDLTLADSTDRIDGRATVQVDIEADTLTAVRLDLLSPEAVRRGRAGAGMEVARVREQTPDGGATSVSFKQTPAHLHIRPDTLRVGQRRTFIIDYGGVPADGLVIGTNRHGDRTFFGDNWPSRARHWLPVVDLLSDKAPVSFRVPAPPHYRVVANGERVSDSLTTDRRTVHWRSEVPLPTKVMVIGVADFAVDSVATVDGVPVESWVYPEDRTAGFEDLGQAPGILRFFEEHIGPYPYPKLANVQSATRYGGMENASAIFYSEEAVADGRDSEELIAHEIAHQWYGNTVTEADWPHLWLSEGFATYLTGLWLEETYGKERLRQYMRRARDRARTFARQRPDEPLVDTTYASPMELLNPNAYQKGAWVLHMLRQEIGTETFWTALRQYYDRYRHANASTADFRTVVEDVSGRDLEAFFEQWTRRAGHPVLQIDWSHRTETESCVVEVRQIQEAPPFRVPLDIQVEGADAESRTVELRGRQTTSELPCPTPPAQLRIDPNVRLLGEWTVEPRRD